MKRVVVTGAGVVSPLADRPEDLHRALVLGESGVRPVESFDTGGLGGGWGVELNGFSPERYLPGENLRPLDRTGRLAAAAALLALEDAGWSEDLRAEAGAGLVLGTLFGSVRTIAEFDRRALTAGPQYVKPFDFANSVINAAAGQAAIRHRLTGVNTTIAGGATAGVQAIAHAADLIRSGRARALLAGGAEELCFESYVGFARAGRLAARDGPAAAVPFHARRTGFRLGEGAALLALEDEEHARSRGARILGRVAGGGSAFDPAAALRHAEARPAEAMARAVRAALDDAGLGPGAIDCVSTSASGGPAGDRAEAEGVALALGVEAGSVRAPAATAVKGQLGEALGASGALQAVVALEAFRTGVLPGVVGLDEPEPGLPLAAGAESRNSGFGRALVTALGLDGAAVAVVLESP